MFFLEEVSRRGTQQAEKNQKSRRDAGGTEWHTNRRDELRSAGVREQN
jgi:hypothetical protein